MTIEKYKITSKLIEIRLDDEEIVKEYGEPVIFYMQDHPKLTTYFNFYEYRVNGHYEKLEDLMRLSLIHI